ncbi:MAG: dienelactone hydrolase family protein, partial [Ktedonobacteraceae bacterium]
KELAMAQEGQIISFIVGQTQFGAYMVRPAGEGPFPGIVIIHEIFGLTENIKDIAQRFADVGYVALAVDLFTGRNRTVCMFRFMGQMLFTPLNNTSVHALKESLTFLAQQPGVDAEKLGAIGFCMGGGFAIAWASTDNRLKAIAPYYASNPRPLEAVSRLCPVVGSYPDKDFTTAQGQKLDVELDRYNVAHDIKIYPGTKHSFFNDKGRNYNEAAAKDSWQRVIAFFQAHI